MTNEEMYNLIIEDIKKCTNEQSKKEVKDLWIRFCESLFYPVYSKDGEHVPYHPLETIEEKQAMLRVINKIKKI